MRGPDDPVVKALNEGENRYRQTVLSQGPLPRYPVIERDTEPVERAGVPGEWTCDKCGFCLSTRTLHARDGSISARAVMETPTCPNDGQALRSMTWRELAESQREGVIDLSRQLSAAHDALHELIRPDNGYCNQCHGAWTYRRDGAWVYSDGQHNPHCIGRSVFP